MCTAWSRIESIVPYTSITSFDTSSLWWCLLYILQKVLRWREGGGGVLTKMALHTFRVRFIFNLFQPAQRAAIVHDQQMFVGSSGRDPFSSNATRLSPFLRQLEETQRTRPLSHSHHAGTLPPTSSAVNTSMHVLELPYHSIVGSVTHHHRMPAERHGSDTVAESTAHSIQVTDALKQVRGSIQSPTLPHTYFVDPLSQSHPQQPQSTRFMSPLAASWGRGGALYQHKEHSVLAPEIVSTSQQIVSSAQRAESSTTRRTLQAPPQSPPPMSASSRQEISSPPQWSQLMTRLMAPSFLSPSHKKNDDHDVVAAKGAGTVTPPPHRYATEATEVAAAEERFSQVSAMSTTLASRSTTTAATSVHQRYAPLPPDLVGNRDGDMAATSTDIVVSELLATPSRHSHRAVSDVSSSDGGALASPISVRHDDSKASAEDFLPQRRSGGTDRTFASPRRPPPPPPSAHSVLIPNASPVRQAPPPPQRGDIISAAFSASATVSARTTKGSKMATSRQQQQRLSPTTSSSSSTSVSDDLESAAFVVKIAEAYAYDCFVRDSSYYMHPVLAKAFHSRESSDRNTIQDSQVIELGSVCTAFQIMLARSKLVKVEEELRGDIGATASKIFQHIVKASHEHRLTRCETTDSALFTSRSRELLSTSISTAPLTPGCALQADPIAEALQAPAVAPSMQHAKQAPRPVAVKATPLSDEWVDTFGSWLLSDRSPENRRKRVQSSMFTSPNHTGSLSGADRAETQRPLNVAQYLLGHQPTSKRMDDSSDLDMRHLGQRRLGPVRPKASVAILAAVSVPSKRSAARDVSPPKHLAAASRTEHSSPRGVFHEELATFHKVHVAPSRAVVVEESETAPHASFTSPSLGAVAAEAAGSLSPPRAVAQRLYDLREAILAEELSDSSSSSSSRSQTPQTSIPLQPLPTIIPALGNERILPLTKEDNTELEEVHVRLSASTSLGSLSVDGISE
jgi:hypothetical protein